MSWLSTKLTVYSDEAEVAALAEQGATFVVGRAVETAHAESFTAEEADEQERFALALDIE